MNTKICFIFKEDKAINLFSIRNKSKGYYQSYCKSCHLEYKSEYDKAYRKKDSHKKYQKKYQKEYSQKNRRKGHISPEQSKKYRENINEDVKKRVKESVTKSNIKIREELRDCYVRGLLKGQGINNPNNEQIEQKRLSLKITRRIYENQRKLKSSRGNVSPL